MTNKEIMELLLVTQVGTRAGYTRVTLAALGCTGRGWWAEDTVMMVVNAVVAQYITTCRPNTQLHTQLTHNPHTMHSTLMRSRTSAHPPRAPRSS